MNGAVFADNRITSCGLHRFVETPSASRWHVGNTSDKETLLVRDLESGDLWRKFLLSLTLIIRCIFRVLIMNFLV